MVEIPTFDPEPQFTSLQALSHLVQISSTKARLDGSSTQPGAPTPDHLALHVAGSCRIGIIPFLDATHVKWACIDLDVVKWPEPLDTDDPQTFEHIGRLSEALGAKGLSAHLERSRTKGWHLWVIFDKALSASIVRAGLKAISLEAGIPAGAIAEADYICPRQATIEDADGKQGYGNGTYLPLHGADTVSNRFYGLDPDSDDWLPVDEPKQGDQLASAVAKPSTSDTFVAYAKTKTNGEDPLPKKEPVPAGVIKLGRQWEALIRLIGGMRQQGWGDDEILPAALALNARFQEPASEAEVSRTVAEKIAKWPVGVDHSIWISEIHDDPDSSELPDVGRFTFLGGNDWEVLSAEPEPAWVLDPMLREGTVTLIGSPPFTGKTRFCMWLAMHLAAGIDPWEGSKALGAIGVLYLGYDTHATARSLLGTAASMVPPVLEHTGYQERLMIAGHSATGGPFPINRYRLDTDGTQRIEGELLGRYFDQTGELPKLIVVDTLSTALPLGIDENENPAVNAVLAELGSLAIRINGAVLVPHHPSKGGTAKHFDPDDFNSYVRGASSMAGAVGILSGLWAPRDEPQKRALTVWTNYRGMERQWFEVCSEERAGSHWIDYWKASKSPVATGLDSSKHLLASEVLKPGEELNAGELSARFLERGLVFSERTAMRVIPILRKRWEADQTVVVRKGPGNKLLIRLASPEEQNLETVEESGAK